MPTYYYQFLPLLTHLYKGISDMAQTASQYQVTVSQAMHAILETDIHTTLHDLVRKINWNDYSCLVVLDDDKKFFGMITEQDIISARKKKMNFNTARAWEIASTSFKSVAPDTTLQEAIELMIDHQARQLIVEVNGKIKGIITPLDILALINWDEPRDITVPNYTST